jgi:Icc-related predicted phosphoesterase
LSALLRRKRPSSEGTTILFCSDLHGSTTCFKKFLNAPPHYARKGHPINALVMGGDVTGKLVVPMIQEGSSFRAYLTGKQHELSTREEVAAFVGKCETMGVYAHPFSRDEYESFSSDPELQHKTFKELMLDRLRTWIELAEQRLEDGVFCSMMPGNDDIPEVDEILAGSERVIDCDRKVVHLDDEHEMLTLGASNITPFDCPRDVPEEQLAEDIEALVARIEDSDSCIFNIHVPPYESGIDEAPVLDENLRPQVGPQGVEMASVGSTAVRDAILRHQPLVGLHGHIHESRGTARIGRTMCLNPGSEYSEGVLRAALVTIRGPEIVSHMLISG